MSNTPDREQYAVRISQLPTATDIGDVTLLGIEGGNTTVGIPASEFRGPTGDLTPIAQAALDEAMALVDAKAIEFETQVDAAEAAAADSAAKAAAALVSESNAATSAIIAAGEAKRYATLALANAAIGSLATDQAVEVTTDGTNNGMWYKATGGATSLTFIGPSLPTVDEATKTATFGNILNITATEAGFYQKADGQKNQTGSFKRTTLLPVGPKTRVIRSGSNITVGSSAGTIVAFGVGGIEDFQGTTGNGFATNDFFVGDLFPNARYIGVSNTSAAALTLTLEHRIAKERIEGLTTVVADAIVAAPTTAILDGTDRVLVRHASDGLSRSVSYDAIAGQIGRRAPLYATTDLKPQVRPAISGNVISGQTLTLDLGIWPVPVASVWQWMQDGAPIAGATGLTYVVTVGDVGKTITAVLSVTETGGSRRATAIARVMAAMPATVASIVAMGDSITAGQGAGADANRWLNLLGVAMSATINNQGRSGTVLQNSPDATGSAKANNGRDRYVSDLMGINAAELVIVAYGFNDARYVANPDKFNVSAYINDFREVVSGLLASGYPRNRILIVTPHYIIPAGLGTGSDGFYGQSRAGFEAYVAASKQVADEFGVYWADSYTAMKAAVDGGQSIITGDDIHPNPAGNVIIKDVILAARKRADPETVVGATDFFYAADGDTILQHMPEIGLAWERQTGFAPAVDAQFANGRLFSPVAGAVYHSLTQNPSADYYVETDLYALDTAASSVGVIGRASPRLGTFYAAQYDRASGGFGLFKTVDGVGMTQLGAYYADAFTAGNARTLRLTMLGTAISLQVDGVSRVAVTDADIALPGFGGVRFGLATTRTAGVHMTRYVTGGLSSLLNDTFTGTDGALLTAHLPEVGLGYVLQVGFSAASSPVILSNRVRSVNTSSIYRNLTPPPSADYAVEGVFDFVGTLVDDCGVIGRASATDQTLYFLRYTQTAGWALWKVVAGTQSSLATYGDDFSAGSRTARLTMKGSAISAQIDGITVMSVVDSAIAGPGFAGLRLGAAQSASTGRHITSLKVLKV